MWALTSVCALLAVALHERGSLIVLLPATAWAVTSSTVGVLIVRRRHENPIGWILCASAFFFAFGLSSGTYAVHALVTRPGSLPAGEVAAWLSAWTLEPVYLMFVYLFALFPDGHTLSRRGRLLLWIAGILMAAGIVVEAFGPGPVQADEPFRNPLGVEAAGFFILVAGLVDLLTGLLLVLSVVSVYLRYRRAGGIERQQIKWLAYAASLLGAVAAVGTIDALLLDVFG
jgi:hypothetical protein